MRARCSERYSLPLSVLAVSCVTTAALTIATWARSPTLAAAASLLAIGALRAATRRTPSRLPCALALDCIAQGLFASFAGLVTLALVALDWIEPSPALSPFAQAGLGSALVLVFVLLRLGRRDGGAADRVLVFVAFVLWALPSPELAPLRLGLCAAAALFVIWRGQLLIGPVATALLRAGER
jgi:hypothetical protein